MQRSANERITHHELAERFNRDYKKDANGNMNIGYMSADVCLLKPQNVTDIASKPNEEENTATDEKYEESKRTNSVATWHHPKNFFCRGCN